MPKSDMGARHCCSGEVHFACFQYDRFIQRPMLIFVVFAKKYSEKNGVARYLHATPPLSALTFDARTCPAQTATRHSAFERTIFPTARPTSPSFRRLRFCKLKEENVVYPPQKPVMTNWRGVVPKNMRPSGPMVVAANPMTKEPTTLTSSVPQGKVSPIVPPRSPSTRTVRHCRARRRERSTCKSSISHLDHFTMRTGQRARCMMRSALLPTSHSGIREWPRAPTTRRSTLSSTASPTTVRTG